MLKYLTCISTFLTFCHFANAAQPNILLIYTDDLGYGDLGSYGHPVIKTPNIDSLASEGLKFTSNYSPSGLCSPSRAGLLTGRIPYRTGIKSWIPNDSGIYLRDSEITLGEVLKDAGYNTALIGKWHLNSDLSSTIEPQPNDQGFDYYYGHNAFQLPHNQNPTNIYRNKTSLPTQKGFTADLYANEAIRWLENTNSSKPFFLYLSMAEPHTSFANPPEYNEMYKEYSEGEVIPIPNGGENPPKELLVPRGPGEYYANITYMDAQIGRVLNWLKKNKLYDETIILFSSDNGAVTPQWINWWEVNAYGSTGGYRGRKHFLYEGGIRVPAIIRYPKLIEPGSINDTPITGMDWFVTLAKLGSGKVPNDRQIDGIDIRPLFSGKHLLSRSLFWALNAKSDLEYAIRKGAWKLLLNREGIGKELYNLNDDPMEVFNLISSKEEIAKELNQEALDIIKDISEDPLRPKNLKNNEYWDGISKQENNIDTEAIK